MRKGAVDNHNSTSKYAKSLNKEARKKELHKITRENQVRRWKMQDSETGIREGGDKPQDPLNSLSSLI